MAKIWYIIKHEYSRHVFEKRFLFSLLSLPALILATAGLIYLLALILSNRAPIGYVDHAGILDNAQATDQAGTIFNPQIDFISYSTEGNARADLDEEIIQAYYIIPEDYPQSLNVQLVFYEQPAGSYQAQFAQYVRKNLGLFDDLDPLVEQRLQATSLVTVTNLDGTRTIGEGEWLLILIPFAAGVIFIIVVLTSGGYLLQAVVEEKENRTMEIVITSVTPNQLMTGKIIGNIGVGLTQLLVWLLFGWIAILIAGRIWPAVQGVSIPADFSLVIALVMLPSFVMIAAIMSAIGSTMTELQEAQQVSGMFSLLITIPFYVVTPIMNNPNGILARVLSFFPFSAPITLLMRMGFAPVPGWEMTLSISILILFAILAVWFAGRVFHMGMLRYGKKLSLKEIFGKKARV